MSSTERNDDVRETSIVIMHFEMQEKLKGKGKNIKKVAVCGNGNMQK
jgi:hypothetical protein